MVNNKVALVTGGARRLGKDISIALAKSGFDIVLNYNKSGKKTVEETVSEITQTGSAVTAMQADISNESEIKKLFKTISLKYGKLDLLVNNAAVFEHLDFMKTTEKDFDRFINTNLKSVFFCCQEAAKIMLKEKNDQGRIINIASLGGIENWTGYIPYSLSKVSVIKLTMQLGKKFAPKILVNAIAPGTVLIENDINDTIDFEEVKKYPMKRFASSKDITSMILYLAIENNYITGQTFVIDGGRSL